MTDAHSRETRRALARVGRAIGAELDQVPSDVAEFLREELELTFPRRTGELSQDVRVTDTAEGVEVSADFYGRFVDEGTRRGVAAGHYVDRAKARAESHFGVDLEREEA